MGVSELNSCGFVHQLSPYRFDGGYWQKDAEMFKSVAKARWENVILDDDKKKAVQTDVIRFFESRARYNKLNVPWKRGVIVRRPFLATFIAQ